MHWTHVKNADLNLLPALQFLIEEQQVKGAADRFGLSQPAMSRVLQRLRHTFGDELLIRTSDGYEPTLRAQRIQKELHDILWRLETILCEVPFDPQTAADTFTIACSDFSTFMQVPGLSRLMSEHAPGVSLDMVSFSNATFAEAERGITDLVLWVDHAPAPFLSEELFVEEYVCVMSKDHPSGGGALSLDAYLRYPHVAVSILGGRQVLLDDRIGKLGGKRTVRLKVPYFAAAIAAVPETDLIATVPRRIAQPQADAGLVSVTPAPEGIDRISYIMAWHPRLTNDPAHEWLRSIVRDSAAGL